MKFSCTVRFVVPMFFVLSNASADEPTFLAAEPGRSAILKPDERLWSPNGQFVLVMQGDGNVVLYDSKCGRGVGDPKCSPWDIKKSGQGGKYLAMQEDGNLVVYDDKLGDPSHAIWNTETSVGSGHYFLAVQDDSNVVVYKGSSPSDNQGVVWSSKHGKHSAATGPDDNGRIVLGTAEGSPCSKMEWRQGYNATLKTGRQQFYAYAHIDREQLNQARDSIESCAKDAALKATIAAIVTKGSAALPTFKAAFAACLEQKKVNKSISEYVSLSGDSECQW